VYVNSWLFNAAFRCEKPKAEGDARLKALHVTFFILTAQAPSLSSMTRLRAL